MARGRFRINRKDAAAGPTPHIGSARPDGANTVAPPRHKFFQPGCPIQYNRPPAGRLELTGICGSVLVPTP
jgi:hypothetical protein